LLVYIMVDDMEKTIEAVIANGGTIVQPVGMDAPEITARFSDPAGNIIGLYQIPIEYCANACPPNPPAGGEGG
jgi:uncharacterized protein